MRNTDEDPNLKQSIRNAWEYIKEYHETEYCFAIRNHETKAYRLPALFMKVFSKYNVRMIYSLPYKNSPIYNEYISFETKEDEMAFYLKWKYNG